MSNANQFDLIIDKGPREAGFGTTTYHSQATIEGLKKEMVKFLGQKEAYTLNPDTGCWWPGVDRLGVYPDEEQREDDYNWRRKHPLVSFFSPGKNKFMIEIVVGQNIWLTMTVSIIKR